MKDARIPPLVLACLLLAALLLAACAQPDPYLVVATPPPAGTPAAVTSSPLPTPTRTPLYSPAPPGEPPTEAPVTDKSTAPDSLEGVKPEVLGFMDGQVTRLLKTTKDDGKGQYTRQELESLCGQLASRQWGRLSEALAPFALSIEYPQGASRNTADVTRAQMEWSGAIRLPIAPVYEQGTAYIPMKCGFFGEEKYILMFLAEGKNYRPASILYVDSLGRSPGEYHVENIQGIPFLIHEYKSGGGTGYHEFSEQWYLCETGELKLEYVTEWATSNIYEVLPAEHAPTLDMQWGAYATYGEERERGPAVKKQGGRLEFSLKETATLELELHAFPNEHPLEPEGYKFKDTYSRAIPIMYTIDLGIFSGQQECAYLMKAAEADMNENGTELLRGYFGKLMPEIFWMPQLHETIRFRSPRPEDAPYALPHAAEEEIELIRANDYVERIYPQEALFSLQYLIPLPGNALRDVLGGLSGETAAVLAENCGKLEDVVCTLDTDTARGWAQYLDIRYTLGGERRGLLLVFAAADEGTWEITTAVAYPVYLDMPASIGYLQSRNYHFLQLPAEKVDGRPAWVTCVVDSARREPREVFSFISMTLWERGLFYKVYFRPDTAQAHFGRLYVAQHALESNAQVYAHEAYQIYVWEKRKKTEELDESPWTSNEPGYYTDISRALDILSGKYDWVPSATVYDHRDEEEAYTP